METSLISKLRELKDVRRAEGTRHDLSTVLVITIMAFMSQIYTIRGIGKFSKRHQEDLIKCLNIKKNRIPSYPTVRRVLMNIDFNELTDKFKQWIIENNLLQSEDWVSLDGKSIKSTVTNYNSPNQNFTSIVSAFAHNSGLILLSESYQNKKTSEIPVVENLVASLGLEGITFTMDALHSKKNSGQDSRD